jgi:hypothetical protein
MVNACSDRWCKGYSSLSSETTLKAVSAQAKLLPLLDAIANGRTDLALGGFDDGQIAWIVQSGLGAACFHAAKENPENLSSHHWPTLTAAEMTARCIAAEHREAVTEIIDAARVCIPQLVLLKGISVADEAYPQFHWRPMRDIDLLVPCESLARMEKVLRELGYRQTSELGQRAYDFHHHTMPFFHAERGVWVEVHHHLISSRSRASQDRLFELAHVFAEIRKSQFHGREVYRLSPELQVAYLAVHWAQDFKEIGGMIAVLDLIFLLQRRGLALGWERLLAGVDRSATAVSLYLLLSYLDSRRLIALPREILHRLSVAQRVFGGWTLAAAHRIIDRYLLDGTRYGVFLSRRTLQVTWDTLALPMPAACKVLLMPVQLCMPSPLRLH